MLNEKAKKLRTLQQKKVTLQESQEKLTRLAKNRAFTTQEQAQFDGNADEIDRIDQTVAALSREMKRSTSTAAPIASLEFEQLDGEKFASIGEQLCAVARSARTGGLQIDPRLIPVGSDRYREITAAAAGANEATPSEGGFLVETDFAQDLLQRTYDTGELMGRCSEMEVSNSANKISVPGIDEQSRANGSRFGGIQAFWANEASSVSTTKAKFRRIELVLNKLIGLTFATDELLADAAALTSFINTAFPLEFGFRIEDAIVNGLGNGQPMGLLNHPALVTVAKDAGQAANTVSATNVMNMWSRCWGPSRKNAVWLIDQSIEPQLFSLTMPGTTVGFPIYLPPGGLSAAPYGTLFGRPVIPTEYNAALSSLGDIILGDFSQYLLARKSALQAATSMHVNFTTDEMAFRFTLRIDGQPTWHTALTPKNGGNTLSPFVTLQAR